MHSSTNNLSVYIRKKNVSSYWTFPQNNILKAFKVVVLPLSNEFIFKIHIFSLSFGKSHLQHMITVTIFGVNKPSI